MRKWAGVVMVAAAAACGGGGDTAPAPVINPPTITTANTMIHIGQSVTFAATGSGTIRWGGDNANVATVDQTTGRVSGIGNGRVTIWAENDGGRTTRLLRGLPSYAGTWEGTYAVASCQASGDIAAIGFCGTFNVGQVAFLGLNLSQADDRVSGQFALGSLVGNVSQSTIAESGVLPLTGAFTSGEVSINITNAQIDSPSAGVLTGRFDQVWTVAGASGAGILGSEIRSVNRLSGGPAFGLQAPSSGAGVSLEEAMRRVLRGGGSRE